MIDDAEIKKNNLFIYMTLCSYHFHGLLHYPAAAYHRIVLPLKEYMLYEVNNSGSFMNTPTCGRNDAQTYTTALLGVLTILHRKFLFLLCLSSFITRCDPCICL